MALPCDKLTLLATEPTAIKLSCLLYTSGRDRDPYDYIGSGKIPGYAVFNLTANYKFDNGISLFAKVDNIFNRNYATAGDLGRNPFNAQGVYQINPVTVDGDWNNTTFIGPGAPRAAWTVSYTHLDVSKRQI